MFGRARRESDDLEDLPPIESKRPAAERVRRRAEGSGPFDVDDPEVDDVDGGLDFGSLRIPMPARAQLQVEPGANGLLKAVHVLVPAGRVSLSALAAPRSSPLWRELAEEISVSLAKDGTRVRSEWGEWGREVQAASEGALSRFIGVDGPRWMLYGVATGPEEDAEEAAETLRAMIRGTVVTRGAEPLPVKTVLPLRVPEHLAERVEQAREEARAAASAGKRSGRRRSIGRAEQAPVREVPAPAAPPPGSRRPAAAHANGHPAEPARAPGPPAAPAPRVPPAPVQPPSWTQSPDPGATRPGLPPVPTLATQETNGIPRAGVESTWSMAKPVVSAEQVARQPAWAQLSAAPSFWPEPPRRRPAAPPAAHRSNAAPPPHRPPGGHPGAGAPPGGYRGAGQPNEHPGANGQPGANGHRGAGQGPNGQPANAAPAMSQFGNVGPGNGQFAGGARPNGQFGTGPQPNGRPGSGPQANGQFGTGPQANGQFGTGPQANGRFGSGPQANGQFGTGPQANGQPGSGPQANGQFGTGPQANGQPGSGPQANGRFGDGASANGRPAGGGASPPAYPANGGRPGGWSGSPEGGHPGHPGHLSHPGLPARPGDPWASANRGAADNGGPRRDGRIPEPGGHRERPPHIDSTDALHLALTQDAAVTQDRLPRVERRRRARGD